MTEPADDAFRLVAAAVTALAAGEERSAEDIAAQEPELVALTACQVLAALARQQDSAGQLEPGTWWSQFCLAWQAGEIS